MVIEAPPKEVLAVWTDWSTNPFRNPILVSVEGGFVGGNTVSVGMKNPDGSIASVQPVDWRVIPHAEINQFRGMTGILTFDHKWLLEQVDAARECGRR